MCLPKDLEISVKRDYFSKLVFLAGIVLLALIFLPNSLKILAILGIIYLIFDFMRFLTFISSENYYIIDGIVSNKELCDSRKDYGKIKFYWGSSSYPLTKKCFNNCKVGDNVWLVFSYGKSVLVYRK